MSYWRVFSADRATVEPAEGTATLRRWYLLLVQVSSLSLASVAAIILIHQLLQLSLVPALDARVVIGEPLAMLRRTLPDVSSEFKLHLTVARSALAGDHGQDMLLAWLQAAGVTLAGGVTAQLELPGF